MHKRHGLSPSKGIILAVLLCLIFIVQPLSALTTFTSPTATLDDKATALQYSSFLYKCLKDGAGKADMTGVADWWIFKSDLEKNALPFGHYSSSPTGKINCSDRTATKTVLMYFGYQSAQEFLCDIKARHDDGKACGTSSNDFVVDGHADDFKRIMNARLGFDLTNPPGEVRYVFYLQTYTKACQAAATKLYVQSTDAAAAQSDTGAKIRYITLDGKTDADYLYKSEVGKGKEVEVIANGLDGSDGRANCGWLVDRINSNAAAMASWVKSHPSGSSGNLGTCTERYTDPTLTKACQDGFDNKSNPNYCAVTYASANSDQEVALAQACEYGLKATAREGSTSSIDPTKVGKSEADTAKSTCGITGVGWIVCPVMTFLADVMDNTFKFLADSFLSTDPEVFKIGNPTQKAWSIFLSYANVAFVIVFMIIIYSQITSAGIGNYGIKKMLPRLIVSAILVNISYYICQAAIDLSNILGYSILNLFTTVTEQVGPGVSLDWNGTIAAVIAIGAAAGLLIALGGSFLIAALLAVAMVVLILLARKAIIILLVVLSPLAFVAYLLPNTESLFNRWRKMLTTVLLVFPIISLVFGASKLASAIIYNTDKENMVVKLMALGIAAIPLFVILPLLKGAMAAVPVIGGKLQGMSNKATGRASSAGKKGMNDRYTNSTLGRLNKYRAGEASKRSALIQAGAYKGRAANPLNWSRNIRSGANSRFNKSGLSGGFGDKTAAAGSALADKQTEEEINAAKSTLGGKTFDDINQMAHDTKLDEATRTAAIRHIMEKGNFSQRNALVKASKSMSSLQRNAVVSGVMSRGDSAVYGAKIGDAITRGEVGSDADVAGHVAQNIADGKIKAETMVHDADATRLIADVTTGGGSYTIKDSSGTATLRTLSTVETTAVRDAAATAASLPATASKVSQNFKDQFGRL